MIVFVDLCPSEFIEFIYQNSIIAPDDDGTPMADNAAHDLRYPSHRSFLSQMKVTILTLRFFRMDQRSSCLGRVREATALLFTQLLLLYSPALCSTCVCARNPPSAGPTGLLSRSAYRGLQFLLYITHGVILEVTNVAGTLSTLKIP